MCPGSRRSVASSFPSFLGRVGPALPPGREQWRLCERLGGRRAGIERDAGVLPDQLGEEVGGASAESRSQVRQIPRVGGWAPWRHKHPAWCHASLQMQMNAVKGAVGRIFHRSAWKVFGTKNWIPASGGRDRGTSLQTTKEQKRHF